MLKRPKTFIPSVDELPQEAYLVNADGKVLGRLAGQVARLLQGKQRAIFDPHMDGRDMVVVVNAGKVRVTGHKEKQKSYFRHSGYPRGDKLIPFAKLKQNHPDRIIKFAVAGMLPKNRLQDRRLRRLKVFAGAEHPYTQWKLKEVTL